MCSAPILWPWLVVSSEVVAFNDSPVAKAAALAPGSPRVSITIGEECLASACCGVHPSAKATPVPLATSAYVGRGMRKATDETVPMLQSETKNGLDFGEVGYKNGGRQDDARAQNWHKGVLIVRQSEGVPGFAQRRSCPYSMSHVCARGGRFLLTRPGRASA